MGRRAKDVFTTLYSKSTPKDLIEDISKYKRHERIAKHRKKKTQSNDNTKEGKNDLKKPLPYILKNNTELPTEKFSVYKSDMFQDITVEKDKYYLSSSDSDEEGQGNTDQGITLEGQIEEDEDRTEITRKMFKPWKMEKPIRCSDCGAVAWDEERTNKRNKKQLPTFAVCCKSGKVKLPMLKKPPEILENLINTSNGNKSRKFKEEERGYNSMFAFTSTGGKVDKKINNGKGPYVYKISGQNHHRIGSLLPLPGTKGKFAQLYFHDTKHEVENRIRALQGNDEETNKLDKSIIQDLINMLNAVNPLAKVFRMARDRYAANQSEEMRIRLIAKRTKDARTYNLPETSEIAALMIGAEGGQLADRDVIVEQHNGPLRRITECHPSYMALQYPLLFPYAEDSFIPGILYHKIKSKKPTARTTVSMREFYAFRIALRLNEGHALLRGGRLFQQYLVDAYTAIEDSRLRYINDNQDDIRAELYQGLQDNVVNGDESPASVGRRIVLPASFTGGPRHMVQNYQDALAICTHYGPPDLFITMTCNPKWPEVDDYMELLPGEKSENHPEASCRVFRLKLQELMNDLSTGRHFGKVNAVLYTIEFQKRGLPHAHILLFLADADKPKTPERVNKIISAELPDKDKDPVAYEAVVNYMIHGPCGPLNMESQCMEDGKCGRKYPKATNTATKEDKFGYFQHRRRNDGRTAIKNGKIIDNKWVVPHNVDLIVKFQCHINVEICNQARAIKYLFKYIHKGNDAATFVIEKNVEFDPITKAEKIKEVDEIKRFHECRYMSASEAAYRLLEFGLQYKDPKVERLDFHLENEHLITYNDDDTQEEIEKKSKRTTTKLLQWMKRNREDPSGLHLTYAEYPKHYVWHDETQDWQPRKRGRSIGRIYFTQPTSGEKYYMRLLLNHVRGCTDFKEIKKYNDKYYDTYKDACYARGLLEDDGEWHEALRQAGTWSTPRSLRRMFVTLLLHCEVTDPLNLWSQNWESLSEDIEYDYQRKNNGTTMTEEEIQNEALCEIEILLNKNGRSIKDFHPLTYPDMSKHNDYNNRLIQEELKYDTKKLQEEFLPMYERLNKEQKEVFEIVQEKLDEDKGGFYFVYGSGGTGKTFLWKTILTKVRSEGKIALAVASSGIASLLLEGGRTAHSRFKIPLKVNESSTCSISKGTQLHKLILKAKLIIWDEAPMTHKHVFEAVDKTFRDLMNNKDEPFGGKLMLLGGDFRQTLPVVPQGSRHDIVSASISKSNLWNHCKQFKLTENMRLKSNSLDEAEKEKLAQFTEWMLDLGEGKLPTTSHTEYEEKDWIEIPEDMIIPQSKNSIKQIIESTYPEIKTSYKNTTYLRDRCILTPKNEDVEKINKQILDMIPTVSQEYYSADSISPLSANVQEQDILYTTEYLNKQQISGMPNHLIELKIGVPIMLMRNIDPSSGMCNGTRMIVTNFKYKAIEAVIITGSHIGELVNIHRVICDSQPTKIEFMLRRRQFPIKVCFAMTINKSQGQTLEKVGIYLPRPVFCHGQLYVAVSRGTHQDGIKILMDKEEDEPDKRTKNIVYDEIFEDLKSGTQDKELKDESGGNTEERMEIQPDTIDDYQSKKKATTNQTNDGRDGIAKGRKRKQLTKENTRENSTGTNKSSRQKITISNHIPKQAPEEGPKHSTNTRNHTRGMDLIQDIPEQICRYITDYEDVLGDGNCGFRAMALCLNWSQNAWLQMRTSLIYEVNNNRSTYQLLFGNTGPDRMIRRMRHETNTFAQPHKWMDMPATGFVFAQAFNAVVVSLSNRSSWTCPPILREPDTQGLKIFGIAHVGGNHYIKVNLEEGCPLPPIPEQYNNATTKRISSSWKTLFHPRLESWNQLQIPNQFSILSPYGYIIILD